jgi:acetyl esterase/lipase
MAIDLPDEFPLLAVPARQIPVAETVSVELRRIMASAGSRTSPLPTTNEDFQNPGSAADQEGEILDLLGATGTRFEARTVGGVDCFLLSPDKVADPDLDRLIVNFHGGGYVLGAGLAGVTEAVLTAAASGIPCLSVDYRMLPDFPYPAAIDDAVSVWIELLERRPPQKMAITGSSAGGAIVLALVQRLVQMGCPRPAAIVAGAPWSDLSKTGDSYFINDLGYNSYEGGLSALAELYAGCLDLRDPRVSPVYGSFEGFPPTLLLSATRDLFLSNTVRVDQKLRDALVPTRLIVLEGQGHATYLQGAFPEREAVFREVSRFLREHLD